jgi:hypothetical protein
MATAEDRMRLENAWLSIYCSAVSGYPHLEPEPEDDSEPIDVDARDEQLAEDVQAYATDVANGGLQLFVEKFGISATAHAQFVKPRAPRAPQKRRR